MFCVQIIITCCLFWAFFIHICTLCAFAEKYCDSIFFISGKSVGICDRSCNFKLKTKQKLTLTRKLTVDIAEIVKYNQIIIEINDFRIS